MIFCSNDVCLGHLCTARRYWQGLDSLAAPLLALLWPDEALTFATLQVRRVAVAERWRDAESKQ
jgi:hypothetical protein